VPLAENIRRGEGIGVVNSRRTHCVHGHEFTAENTYRDPKGRRQCRECGRRANRELRRRKRESS
jgi:hypothetical protein